MSNEETRIKLPVRYDRDFTLVDAANEVIADVLRPMTLDNSRDAEYHARGQAIADALNKSADLEKQVAQYREALAEALEIGVFGLQDRSGISTPEDDAVRQLGEQIGYGALMDAASRMWRARLKPQGFEGGEFTVGPCRRTHENWIAKATAALGSMEKRDEQRISNDERNQVI